MPDEYVNEVIPPLGSEEPTAEVTAEETEEESGAAPEIEEEETVETPVDDATAETDEAKKAKGVQKRIDELTRQRHEAAREAEYWKGKATQGQQQPERQPEALPPGLPAKPVAESFESYEDFVEALTDWKLSLRDAKAAQKDQEAKNQEVQSVYLSRVDSLRSVHEDFDEAVAASADIFMHDATIQAIKESDHGADLVYYLAKNRAEHQKLAALSVVAQLKALGRLESQLEKKPEATNPTKKVTQAPEPIKPVGSKEKATLPDPNQMSDTEWLDYERKRLAKLGRLY